MDNMYITLDLHTKEPYYIYVITNRELMPRTYEPIGLPSLTNEQKKELDVISKMKNSDIDFSDIPEGTGEGQFYYYQS